MRPPPEELRVISGVATTEGYGRGKRESDMASNTLDAASHEAASPGESQTNEQSVSSEQAQYSSRDAHALAGQPARAEVESSADAAHMTGERLDPIPLPASDDVPATQTPPAETSALALDDIQGASAPPTTEASEHAPKEVGSAPPVVAVLEPQESSAAAPAMSSAGSVDPVAALRAENERLKAELGIIHSRAERQRAPNRARRVVVNTLVVLSCLCLLFSTVTVWAQQTFLSNSTRWTEIVGPIGENPAVINALSAYAADQAVTLLQVQQRARTALPQQAQFLAVPLTNVVRNFAQTQVANVMRSGQFQQAWIRINDAAHTQIVAALRGQSQALTISNNTLTLDLTPVIAQGLQIVSQQLSGVLPPQVQIPDLSSSAQSVQQEIQKLSQALGVPLPQNFGQIDLLQSDQLATAQTVVRLLDVFSILLPLITLLLIVLTLWLSRDRRRTLIQLGIGVVIVFLLAKIGIAYVEQTTLSSITNPTAKSVAQPVMDQALSYIRTSTTWIVVIGVLVALAAFLAGKPEWFKAGYAEVRKGYAWTQHEVRRLRVQLQHAM